MPANAPNLEPNQMGIVKRHKGPIDYSANASANYGSRFAAAVIDGLISTALTKGYALVLRALIGNNTLAIIVSTTIIACVYAIYPLLEWGYTPGKRLLKLRVVRRNGDPRLTLGALVLRECVGKALSAVLLFVGYLMPLFNKQSLALHDYMADTRVVKDDE